MIRKFIRLGCIYGLIFMILGSLIGGVIAYRTVCYVFYKQPIDQFLHYRRIAKRESIIAAYKAHTISITVDSRTTLQGLLIERAQAQRVVIICHGYQQSKESMYRYIDLFPHDTILLFDFRAHGQSSGSYITFGLYEKDDIKAAIAFLKDHGYAQGKQIIGCGHSMGAAALIIMQASYGLCDALIIDSSFAYLYDVLEHLFVRKTGLPKFPFLAISDIMVGCMLGIDIDAIAPAVYARSVWCPVLLIHAKDDSWIAAWHSYSVYHALATDKKQQYVSSCARHVQSIKYCYDEYKKQVTDFLETVS